MESGEKGGLFEAPHETAQRTRHFSCAIQNLLDGFGIDETQPLGNNDVCFDFAKGPVRD